MRLVQDKHASAMINECPQQIVYVDNYAVVGTDKVEVQRQADRIYEQLTSSGLVVHEEQKAE
eukprot:2546824-Amphidinium_carterae.1